MSVADQLLQLEEQFWTAGAEFYHDKLTPDALMVFAEPSGLMARQAIVDSLGAASRWHRVEFEDVRHVPLTSDVGLLTYLATAERE